ncbi:hypothetical protein HQQ81_10455 [Microbacteriaceae bacterium VKM Ac-2854]|nr:hypothetical protein [Microbacteriaceae bacterium VKM Ac-2854]
MSPRALRGAGLAALYEQFRASGYLARQETTGVTVLPKFGMLMGGVFSLMPEGQADAPGQLPVVLLSKPSTADDEFETLAETVRRWSAELAPATRRAISNKIRDLKGVDHGVPATELSAALPAELLVSYRRKGDYVVVIDSEKKGHRRILQTRGIG